MKVRVQLLVLFLFVGGLVGCDDRGDRGDNGLIIVDDEDATQTEDATRTEDVLEVEDASRDPGGPEILDFTVSHTSRLTQNGALNISVSITHPQGFAEIGGGKILGENDAVYTTFVGTGGTFSAALTWAQIQDQARIDFSKDQKRVFVAEFFDAENRRARHPFTIELHCNGAAACDGACEFATCTESCGEISCNTAGCMAQDAFLDDAQNCGTCGNVCSPGNRCRDSKCECSPGADQCNGLCTDFETDSQNCGACGNACPADRQCDEGQCIKSSHTGARCDGHDDCGGRGCYEGICLVACDDEKGCDGDDKLFCYEGLLCYRPCTTKADCGPDEVCENVYKNQEGLWPDRLICHGQR